MKKILAKHICHNLEEFKTLLTTLPMGSIIQYWFYPENWKDPTFRGLIEINVIAVISDKPYEESMGR